MSPDTEEPQAEHRPPPDESWHVGRLWAGVLFVLLSGANLFSVLFLTDDYDTTRAQILTVVRLILVVSFLVVAVGEFRRRVAVDAEGIHIIETIRRRTYPWQDVDEVRLGRPTLLGDAFVYVQRHGAKQVELPNSGGHVRLLQRWHAAMSTR